MCRNEDPAQAKTNKWINIKKKKKNALTPSSSMTSLPLHRPWTISNTWQLSLPQKNKTLSRSLSFYINWLSAWTPLFSVPFFTSCTDFWPYFIYHFFLVPLDWRDWIRCSTHVPPHPLAAATPPSHQLDNQLLHFPFTADPHPLASCLKQRRS